MKYIDITLVLWWHCFIITRKLRIKIIVGLILNIMPCYKILILHRHQLSYVACFFILVFAFLHQHTNNFPLYTLTQFATPFVYNVKAGYIDFDKCISLEDIEGHRQSNEMCRYSLEYYGLQLGNIVRPVKRFSTLKTQKSF